MNCVYRRLRCFFCALAAACIAGCATPNLKPFAEQTARLAQAVAGEQREVSLKFAQVIDLYKEACAKLSAQGRGKTECAGAATRTSQRAAFDVSRSVVDSLLQRASTYADALAELSKAGETGSDAAQSLLGTVKQFGNVIGIAGTVTTAAANALQNIAQAVTRLQAQKSLAEAAEKAREAVTALADGVVTIFNDANSLAIPLYTDEYDLLAVVAGEDLVGLLQDAKAGQDAVGQRIRARRAELSQLNQCASASGEKADNCKALQADRQNAETIGQLLDRLRPEYESVVAKRAEALRWREQRGENAKVIVAAVEAWKEEHARAANALHRCGGLNAYRCAEVNSFTLKALVGRINEIRFQSDK
jgi:hypothetical protein